MQAEPFLHPGALVSVEPLALAVCHEVVDALPRQFHHELPPDNYREESPPVAERTATEPAATRWRDHAVHICELVDQISVPLL